MNFFLSMSTCGAKLDLYIFLLFCTSFEFRKIQPLSSPATFSYLPSPDWWFKERDYKSHTYVEETVLRQCLAFDKQLCSAEHSAACTHRPHVWGLVPQSGLAFAQNVPT